MLFPTVSYAVFFACVFVVAWGLARHPLAWKAWLLAASYAFYGSWSWRFVPLLVGLTLANQACAVVMVRRPRFRRAALAAAVALDLGVLAVFKYLGFAASALAELLQRAGVHASPPLVQFVLPLGISFIVFQALSYVVDVYRGTLRPASTLDLAMYLAFFPHVVAGPIVRASEFVPQLAQPPDARRIDVARASLMIVGGLFKKVVLASHLAAAIVDGVFSTPGRFGAAEVLAGIYGYAVQIYCDFSGYTDIAIGCALLLGVRFPQNFDAPYAATSLQDFWRRWHITLSRWLRDYLYVSLGGNRAGARATYRNLLLTMALGGLWHGAAWTFVVWGLLHGAGLALERFVASRSSAHTHTREEASEPAGMFTRAARVLFTFHLVCLAWVFFRADSVATALRVLGRLGAVRGPAPAVTPAVVAAITAGLAMHFVPGRAWSGLQRRFSEWHPLAQGVSLGLALFVIDLLGPPGVAPFIYFQF